MNEIKLGGCGTQTMMHYLKALGIFRVLYMQKNNHIKSVWKDDGFYISAGDNISKGEIMDFFQKEYRPTPMITPWNGGSGFFKNKKSAKATKNLKFITDSKNPRLEEYQKVIKEAKNMLSSIKYDDKSIAPEGYIIHDVQSKEYKKIKPEILRECRNCLPDSAVRGLDSLYALTSSDTAFNPVLGTGGNDGRAEFINSFMGNLFNVFEETADTKEWINVALFGGHAKMVNGMMGMYHGGCQYGPNMTTLDASGASLINPWEYVLMIEGCMLFAGSTTRRLSAESTSLAAFPFVTEHVMAGDATSAHKENEKKEKPKGEIWIPIWDRKVGFSEIQHIFHEGRAQIGSRQAKNGSEFARAVISLGTERGISEFHRFVIRARNGKSYIMMHAGKFTVAKRKVREAEAIEDLDKWMDMIGRISNKPNSISNGLKRVQDAIIGFASDTNNPQKQLQKILIEAGKMDVSLSTSEKDSSYPVKLTQRWLEYCYDESVEFRLAASLASIVSDEIGPIRTNIEEIEFEKNGSFKWAEKNTSKVNKKNNPYRYLLSILDRRCLDATRKHTKYLPLAGIIPAYMQDILDFLHGRVNASKMLDLFIPLSFIDYNSIDDFPWKNSRSITDNFRYVPYAFGVLKMSFWPYKYCDRYIRFEPRIISLLRANRVDEAFKIAQNSLAHSGLEPLLRSGKAGLSQTVSDRIGASLLFPLEQKTLEMISDEVLRKENTIIN